MWLAAPVTLASLLFLEHARHIPASGLYAYAVPSACDALLPDIHLAHSLSSFPCLLSCLLQEVFLTTLFNSIPITFHSLSLLYISSYCLPPVDLLYINLSQPLDYKLYKGRDLAYFTPWGIPSF